MTGIYEAFISVVFVLAYRTWMFNIGVFHYQQLQPPVFTITIISTSTTSPSQTTTASQPTNTHVITTE